MKKFTKGKLSTIVEDDDRRIPAYLAAGWKEESIEARTPTAAEKLFNRSKRDANASATKKDDNGKKNAASDEKINETIKANQEAEKESEAIDDGLTSATKKEADHE